MNNKFKITWDDVPNDIKELVDVGLYTKEEALELVKKYIYIFEDNN